MAKKFPVLEVEKRKLFGRKVKRLRREGLIPANIYGRKIKSVAIQVEESKLLPLWQKVGETGLVEVRLSGEKKPRFVLLKNPQYHPVTDKLLHLDFHQVSLTEKVTAEVPLEIVGEAPAVKKGEGVLVQLVEAVEVEALPTDLPEKFVVDVSGLKKVDDAVTVADLKVDKNKVTIKAKDDQVLLKIEAPTEEEAEEAPTGEETETPSEGEQPTQQPEDEGSLSSSKEENQANQQKED